MKLLRIVKLDEHRLGLEFVDGEFHTIKKIHCTRGIDASDIRREFASRAREAALDCAIARLSEADMLRQAQKLRPDLFGDAE